MRRSAKEKTGQRVLEIAFTTAVSMTTARTYLLLKDFGFSSGAASILARVYGAFAV